MLPFDDNDDVDDDDDDDDDDRTIELSKVLRILLDAKEVISET